MQKNFPNDAQGRSSVEERPASDRVVPHENEEELRDDLFDTHAKLAEQGHIDHP